MKKIHISLIAVLTCLLLSQSSIAQVKNYYNISDTLTFNDLNYQLSWSSHPNENFYKHEYLLKGEDPNHFNSMALLDFIEGDATLEDAVNAQVQILIKRKKSDPICNYRVLKNRDGDDYILDFLMGVSNGNKLSIVEWNCYRYKVYTDAKRHRGILMFGISYRAYDDLAIPFLQALPIQRKNILEIVRKHSTPAIQIQ